MIETLDIAAMKRSMGRRVFRRSVSDAALGMFRPMLTYKAAWHGTELVAAPRRFASSQIHHGCGCRLVEPKKLAKKLVCAVTGEIIDRDINASLNLRDYPETNAGVVDARAPQASATRRGGGQARRTIVGRGTDRKTTAHAAASPDEARTVMVGNHDGTPRRGAA